MAPSPQYNPIGIEVPFLVNNKEKWISGIVEETTCGDVVKALLAAEGRLKGINEDQLDKFVMVERWRKVGKTMSSYSALMSILNVSGGATSEARLVFAEDLASLGRRGPGCPVYP